MLKEKRVRHRTGAFNGKILRYRSVLWSGTIVDLAPGFTQNILEAVYGETGSIYTQLIHFIHIFIIKNTFARTSIFSHTFD